MINWKGFFRKTLNRELMMQSALQKIEKPPDNVKLVGKVISGGQTGADIIALKVAKSLGIKTGGWVPKGCKTSDGPMPSLLTDYDMKEVTMGWLGNYSIRTEWNVRDSDGTLRLAVNFKSPGEVCTLKAIKKHKKPYFDVDLNNPVDYEEVIKWMVDNNIKILNVAGNSKRTDPNIEEKVENYLKPLFKRFCYGKNGKA